MAWTMPRSRPASTMRRMLPSCTFRGCCRRRMDEPWPRKVARSLRSNGEEQTGFAGSTMTEDSFDRAVQRALRRPAGAGPCPDSAELAAYVDGTLDRAERDGLEAHASACSRCASEL